MRLHRLELTGFGPFLHTQTVDFDAFARDGLFLISGRTGAGKSSILDGICFALYGSVPRYDGGERRVRSDHCGIDDPTRVRLEFTVADVRWRVTRAPEYERPARRGGGVTTEPARVEVEELVDGTWTGRAAKAREAGLLLDEVLGLNAQQFQQVILLAQNKFSRFLLAPGGERQALLRTLFGTRRFDEYKDALDARRREAQRALDAASTQATTLLELTEELIERRDLGGAMPADLAGRREAAAQALQRADYRVEQATTRRTAADADATAAATAHGEVVARAQRFAELVAARARLAELEQQDGRVGEDRARLGRARAAEALRAPMEVVARAEAAERAAAATLAEAQAAWVQGGGDPDADVAQVVDRLGGDLARWEAALVQEHELARLRDESVAVEHEIDEGAEALGLLDAHLALVPGRRASLEAELAEATTRAARRDDAHRLRDGLAERLRAAREAAALSERVVAAEAAYERAAGEATAAGARLTDLLRRRLDGHAGELAAQLVDGEPCAVCGSTSHPRPAQPSGAPVTDDDLARAEAERDEALRDERAAAETHRATRDEHAGARERSGGEDAEALAPLLATAEAAVREADAAADDVERLAAERSALDEQAAAAEAERAAAVALQASRRERAAALTAQIAGLDAAVAEARGEHESIAARVAAATAQRERARAVAVARTALAERERALRDAAADRDARLTASEFSQPADAAAALLDPSAQAALDAAVAEHAAALTATRARLLELELDAADRTVTSDDIAASAAAVERAEAERADAIADQRDAETAAENLRRLVVQADAAYAAVAALADETAVATRLADTVAGRAPNTMKMDLETFVLAAELEEIVAAANLRLTDMSAGRYTLHHSDALAARGAASGLGIEVLDAHTGRLRAPQSLSGGETFLASLALALGMAEVVTARAGGVRLDTLFIDEGFGSLDAETLELAMRTLDELRAGGRLVGVISHVEAMQEQLPAQVRVAALAAGPSAVQQDAAVHP